MAQQITVADLPRHIRDNIVFDKHLQSMYTIPNSDGILVLTESEMVEIESGHIVILAFTDIAPDAAAAYYRGEICEVET